MLVDAEKFDLALSHTKVNTSRVYSLKGRELWATNDNEHADRCCGLWARAAILFRSLAVKTWNSFWDTYLECAMRRHHDVVALRRDLKDGACLRCLRRRGPPQLHVNLMHELYSFYIAVALISVL